MKIEVPDSLKTWLEQQARFDDHPSVDAFVASVLHDKKRRQQEAIDQALREALESGDFVEITPEWWAERRRKLEAATKQAGKAAS